MAFFCLCFDIVLLLPAMEACNLFSDIMRPSSSSSPDDSMLPQNITSSTEEEINVYLKIMKTVPLKVNRSDTVKNLKAMLHEKYGLCEKSQQLFFTGERLLDNQTLVDCGIEKDSTLDLIVQSFERIRIFIKLLSYQRTIVVEARIIDTIKNIKTMFQTMEGMQSDDFTLTYDGKVLKDDSTISSLKVHSGSMFYLLSTPKEVLPIYARTPNGHTVKLEVKVVFAIQDVKAMVGSMAGIDLSDWTLSFAGKQLKEWQTLAYYGIKEGSVLDMSPKIHQIFVKTFCGKTITLVFDQSDTVKTVNRKILEKMKLPTPSCPLKFSFAGRRLEDGRTLASYSIQKDSTLHAFF